MTDALSNRYAGLAARVYELDKPVGRSFGDVEFYAARLKGCDGPVLEPAVGSGRVLVPLLEAGFEVVGFDASEAMLDLCRAACARRDLTADLSVARFDDFAYATRFAAAIVPAGSFQLIATAQEGLAVLRRLHDHLAPGGRLILDLDPVSAVLAPPGPTRRWTDADGEVLTLTEERVDSDLLNQSVVSHLRYDQWTDGRLTASELELFALRWWGVEEMRLALTAAGFADITVSGGYEHGRPPRRDDEVITFEATRL
ncbi:class I SAM-dependent methyltransferase [Brevundimonas diminuta]|uniref:class I SAM-dependent methyltransferase n=1 Tax=Brevundimonas diminuta TaxID=293 RepID=UPI00320AAE2E